MWVSDQFCRFCNLHGMMMNYCQGCLRSSNTNQLSVPWVHTTFASRGFSDTAPLSLELTPFWHTCLLVITYRVGQQK